MDITFGQPDDVIFLTFLYVTLAVVVISFSVYDALAPQGSHVVSEELAARTSRRQEAAHAWGGTRCRTGRRRWSMR